MSELERNEKVLMAIVDASVTASQARLQEQSMLVDIRRCLDPAMESKRPNLHSAMPCAAAPVPPSPCLRWHLRPSLELYGLRWIRVALRSIACVLTRRQ